MASFSLHQGRIPLLLSLPHNGYEIPEAMGERMQAFARSAPDTDWFVDQLYAFAVDMGASILIPRYSRYVIDLNRPPDDVSLYPGQNTTGLCPLQAFSGEAIYREGMAPDAEEIQARKLLYWQPYHAALRNELTRIQQQHGRALLWEGHSIRPELPYLFEGRLPDINMGTANGASFPADRLQRIEALLGSQSAYTWVSNGRFKGGYNTRHYANSSIGIHAFQLELAQSAYMDAEMRRFDAATAAPVQQLIERMMGAALDLPG